MDVRPGRSLGLLSAAHAVNHSFAVLLPPIYLAINDEFGVTVQSVAFLAAAGSLVPPMSATGRLMPPPRPGPASRVLASRR